MMIYIDTNVLLRYLLADDQKQFGQAKAIFDNTNVFILNEVIVETIYVLNKVYDVSKSEIMSVLKKVVEKHNVFLLSKEVILKALPCYHLGLDPVDAILVGMNHILDIDVYSFDKKLNTKLKKK